MLHDLLTITSLDGIKLFYFKYKDSPEFSFGGIGLIILISLLILWKIVLPQTHDWFSIQSEIKVINERITQLQTNQNILSTLSSEQLEEQYTLASTALPYHKDYAGMIEAIDYAAFTSDMEREDYTLLVGNLSTKSAQLSPQTTITVKVGLQGDITKLQKFLSTLNKALPLSEVVSVSSGNQSANVEINFFYKFLPPSTQIPYTDPIRVLSSKNQDLLETLSLWKDQTKTVTPEFIPSVPASESGN